MKMSVLAIGFEGGKINLLGFKNKFYTWYSIQILYISCINERLILLSISQLGKKIQISHAEPCYKLQ